MGSSTFYVSRPLRKKSEGLFRWEILFLDQIKKLLLNILYEFILIVIFLQEMYDEKKDRTQTDTGRYV